MSKCFFVPGPPSLASYSSRGYLKTLSIMLSKTKFLLWRKEVNIKVSFLKENPLLIFFLFRYIPEIEKEMQEMLILSYTHIVFLCTVFSPETTQIIFKYFQVNVNKHSPHDFLKKMCSTFLFLWINLPDHLLLMSIEASGMKNEESGDAMWFGRFTVYMVRTYCAADFVHTILMQYILSGWLW